jgi:DNA-binding NtrC family response regulator
MLKVLVVDDDAALRLSVKSILLNKGSFEVEEAHDGLDAIEKTNKYNYDILLMDVDMPRLNGLEALKKIKELNPGVIIIIMTAFASINSAVQAVKDGAFNYLSKPVHPEDLINQINRAVEAQSLISTIAASSPIFMEEGKKIIGNTAQMQKVFNINNKLSKVDTPVLVRGASGTGKELVARAIHYNSLRKNEKFVAINCSAIPENLFESELFGHEKGSFTGADQRKIGKFQFAEGGTLFLDEVGDMPVLLQVKLLRVLQEKLFCPVGANREIQSNVRIIAATNRPLEEMIKQNKFREDLFYRLNVIPIFLPQLSDRKDDLVSLINIFIKKFNALHGKKVTSVTFDALNALKKYNWPGNIRELENVIEHAFILESKSQLTLGSLPESLLESISIDLNNLSTNIEINDSHFNNDGSQEISSMNQINTTKGFSDDSEEDDTDFNELSATIKSEDLDFNLQKEQFEKDFIIKALKTFKGRINQTALHANIPKKTLLRKIEKYGINAKEFSN